MQPHPGTAVTKTGTPSPLYPTSAAVVATGFLPPANSGGGGGWQTTVTQSGTFSVSSMENQVCFYPPLSFCVPGAFPLQMSAWGRQDGTEMKGNIVRCLFLLFMQNYSSHCFEHYFLEKIYN